MVLQEVTAVGEAAAVLTILHESRATAILTAVVALSIQAQQPTTVPTSVPAPPTTRRTRAATPTPAPATTSPPAKLEAARTTPAALPPQVQDLPASSVRSLAARQLEAERLEAVTIPRRLQAAQAIMGELVRALAQAQVCQVLAFQQTQPCPALQRCRSTQQVERWFLGCHLGFLECCQLNT